MTDVFKLFFMILHNKFLSIFNSKYRCPFFIICIFAKKWGIMCIYINKGNDGFKSAVRGTYIDKTGMIAVINQTLDTERRFTCVTRSRRFGKSMAADMLCAYYDKSCTARITY